jgi:16S rRNA processing protein RimM
MKWRRRADCAPARHPAVVSLQAVPPETRFQPRQLFIERRGQIETLGLTTVRFHHGRRWNRRRTMNDAEADRLRVPVDWLAPLPGGTFYRHHLIGCQVETVSGQPVGTVSDVEGTVAGSRLVIEGPRGEILIPLATEICRAIDVDAKRIVIEPPAGLLELNERAAKGPG